MVAQLSVSSSFPMATLVRVFGPNLQFGRPLAPLSSFKTGGKARYFIQAHSADEVAAAVRGARQLEIPLEIIGGGSNVLISDQGVNGLVVQVAVKGIDLIGQTEVVCGAGVELQALVDFATDNSLTGMEFAAGIWGTVGGAVFGNAGAYGSEISDHLTEVTLVGEQGEIGSEKTESLGFSYRHSRLKESCEIIVSAKFGLAVGDKEKIAARVREILRTRNDKLPSGVCSAGCFFRNIPDPVQEHGKLAAGKLLEDIGAKKLSVGGAAVSAEHANIILNTGNATSKDIRQLADIMKQRVLERFGIELAEEVRQLGEIE